MIDRIITLKCINRIYFQNGDLLQLLVDVDPLQGLPADPFLECETWNGEAVVVPRNSVRLVSDDCELASILSQRPRAQVQQAYNAATSNELTVSVSASFCSTLILSLELRFCKHIRIILFHLSWYAMKVCEFWDNCWCELARIIYCRGI